ncbi:MAG: DUF4301 family protein [Thermodesulfobacteriota bacterium]
MELADIFKGKDLAELERRGVTKEQVLHQLAVFRKGPNYLRLVRPCTLGDGIQKLPEEKAIRLARMYEDRISGLVPAKFVPASGAATRMFKPLITRLPDIMKMGPQALAHLRGQDDPDSREAVRFIENFRDFAFFPRLAAAMEKQGADIEALFSQNEFGPALSFLLHENGLGFAGLPKAMIEFHRYGGSARTPLEEHLIEAADYAVSSEGDSRVHFTVPEDSQEAFERLAREIADRVTLKTGVLFDTEFSIQDPATDTVAVTPEGEPFRNADGSLLFRPAGHGALIGNLNRIQADVIFINNIDNVVPDRLKQVRNLYKKALAGLLLEVQEKVFGFREFLEENRSPTSEQLNKIKYFCENQLLLDLRDLEGEKLAARLTALLSRPLRVCGMVRNLGDPGGAPFFVEDEEGMLSIQIVEGAQVNQGSEEQKKVFASSTHFNPVDVIIAPYDPHGRKYDITRYVDEKAVFISKKSKEGRDLFALELPGLWNGSMSDWNTVFAEVPMEAYDPVKNVNDLLSPSHRV